MNDAICDTTMTTQVFQPVRRGQQATWRSEPRRRPVNRDLSSSSIRQDPNIGRVINGRYRVLSRIAGGAMAVVYLAKQSSLGRTCAIKLLRDGWDRQREQRLRERFFLEASVGSRLSSPNTVRVFDYGCDENDQPYMAMEYVDGCTLRNKLLQSGPMSQRRTLSIAYQLCKSLREAHELGYVHRDVKPDNIILTDLPDQPDFVKLLDFGVVDTIEDDDGEDLTQSGILLGSPGYMAPEQVLGNPVDGRADIYSLGLVMFEMLTGKNPMEREHAGATLMAHVDETRPRPRDIRPDIAPELDAIIHVCLAKKPEDRFADITALVRAFRVAASCILKSLRAHTSIDSTPPRDLPRFTM